jgi:penicillin-binding protein 2
MKSSLEAAFSMRRVSIFTALIGAFFCVLIGRLYLLQVVRGESYLHKSEENFIQERRVTHTRGLLLDQSGQVLVDNRPAHDVTLTAAFLPDSTRSLSLLLAPLGLSRARITQLDADVLAGVEGHERVWLLPIEDDDDCAAVAARRQKYDTRGVSFEPAKVGCTVVVEAADFPSRAAVFQRLREILGVSADELKPRIEQALQKSSGLSRFRPTTLIEDVSYVAYARLQQAISLGEIPGIDVENTQRRRYRLGSRAAHVLGYLNEVSPDELKRQDERRQQGEIPDGESTYVLGDLLGRKGLEASYERHLRGKDGVERVVVDAKGRTRGAVWAESLLGADRLTPPTAGHTLVLSLDEAMQKAAEESFGGVAGSVVALEVDTGFVLAMASFPTYDPNVVTGATAKAVKRALDLDPNRPWTNKAIQDHYAPGSTFKAITATAGLRNKLITETSVRMCPGFFRLGRATWRCYSRGGHGGVALVRALQYSCDTYFYGLGYELGPDRLAEGARIFSFGSRTGIDLGGESPGIMPDRAYYERRFGAYTPGLVVNNSIGQGDVTVTPLQLAVAYAAIANGGRVMKPQLVREILDESGNVLQTFAPEQTADLGLPAEEVALMNEALSHVTDPGGTASGLWWRRDRYADMSKWLRDTGTVIVGKTGTAQVVRLSKSVAHVRAEDVPYLQRDHAWFVGYAPQSAPEVVVVTMTEHGGFGGSTSGPVTAEVLRAYFTQTRATERYSDLPIIESKPRVFAPKKVDEPTEESAAHDHSPETEAGTETDGAPKATPDAPKPAPVTP